MQGVLITDGGPHPASKWAEATASHIIDIAIHVAGEKREKAIQLQAKIIEVLETHHTTVQEGEREALVKHGHDRLCHECDASHHVNVEEIAVDIIAAAKDTPWEKDMDTQATFDGICVLLRTHFATSMHIERSWHADRHPDTPEARAFRKLHHPGE